MAFNVMQGLFTAVILKPRKLPQDKVIAASALSATLPGLWGLALPFLLLKDSKPASAQPVSPAGGPVTVLEAVPDVMGMDQAKALLAFQGIELKAELQLAQVKDGKPGTVVAQQPPPRMLIAKGSTVVLFVQRESPCADADADDAE